MALRYGSYEGNTQYGNAKVLHAAVMTSDGHILYYDASDLTTPLIHSNDKSKFRPGSYDSDMKKRIDDLIWVALRETKNGTTPGPRNAYWYSMDALKSVVKDMGVKESVNRILSGELVRKVVEDSDTPSLCWRCNHSYPIGDKECPKCKAANPNVDMKKAMSQMKDDEDKS